MDLAALHLHLVPVLAAEKNRTAFYIAGGVLVVWAFGLSMGLGMRKANFPGSVRGERAVIATTVVLVATTLAMAVITSGTPSTHAAITKSTHVELGGAPVPSRPAVVESTNVSSTAPAAASASEASSKEPPASSTDGGHKLSIAANASGQLAYNTKSLSATAGKVTITMTNMSPLEHNFTVASGGKVLGATPTFDGGTRSVTLNLKPGKYVFYCSVPGHRQAGMEGTLTVGS